MQTQIRSYPIELHQEDGEVCLLRCPDLPEVITSNLNEAAALMHAKDVVTEALAMRIANGVDLPPFSPANGRHVVDIDYDDMETAFNKLLEKRRVIEKCGANAPTNIADWKAAHAPWVTDGLTDNELSNLRHSGRVVSAQALSKLEDSLRQLNQGYHSNRLAGQYLTKSQYEQLRAWVIQGLSSEEMIARVKAKYNRRYPL